MVTCGCIQLGTSVSPCFLAKKWLATGAQPTETVGKLLKVAGITE